LLSRKQNRNYNRKTNGYKTLYSKSDYKRDEAKFSKSEKTGEIDWSNFQRLMLHDICTNTSILNDDSIGRIPIADIRTALKHPKHYWKILLKVSNELMHISPHYYRLNNMFSNMALFCWWIDLYDVKDNANITTIKKTYSSLSAKLESMNLKHEFSKIMKVIPYQDVYCGLLYENQNDFYIQQISFNICKLYEIQDGLYNFIIDLSKIKLQNLDAYPSYVQQAFLDYKDGKISNWYKPPTESQICIKLNSQWSYPYPLLISLVKDILDLDIYKKLKLQSARTDNYKAILVKVPIDEKTVDKPLLSSETIFTFADINKESMSDDIALLHTLGSEGKAISFKDSSNTRNNVTDAVDALYDSSGESRELFNGSSSGTAVTLSIENDAGFIYGLYRQFERWTNRYIKLKKYNKNAFKFHFYLLDITIFNRDNVSKRYKDAISMGVTCVDKYLASIDMTPSRTLGSYIVHKDIFDFNNNFVPLQTSYNSSSTAKETGRPSNKSKGELLDEAGEKTEDADRNIDR